MLGPPRGGADRRTYPCNTGPESSVSHSITWRSEWSFTEADARAFNSVLRRMGMKRVSTGRWPHGTD